ncbi:MAG: hypothetical protein R3D84_00245 [Paracoccaceae bacterium]
MTVDRIVADPLLPWPILAFLAALAVAMLAFAIWRGLAGWALRALALSVVLTALAGPSLMHETRAPLSDIVVVVSDRTASQRIADRDAQTTAALDDLRDQIARMPGTELHEAVVNDAPDDGGSLLMGRLADSLADVPRARLAGVVLLSDGQAHDADLAPDVGAPVHLLLSGHDDDWDRRLIVRNAPTFAILGEPVDLTLRIEDQGAVPAEAGALVRLAFSIGGEAAQEVAVPVGQDITIPVTLPHGGINVLQFTLDPAPGELTDRNNAAVVQINGVRDRLRVLLVSGEPHAGERVWRNLLKSDSSVDLVHFTILRPPDKQDGVPVTELSLIAFPTRELFIEKIDEFDLIIFDRYRRRGILPLSYLENVRDYVWRGGTVLVASGPEFGSADSLYRSPLADVLPVLPTSRVLDGPFRPAVTTVGLRHPVTEGLEGAEGPEGPTWGRWFRRLEMQARSGEAVMAGPDDVPLLVLDRVGEGRVAMLGSDQAWLWGRGYEGGGPQLELLRRLAHWMLKEPELEEEALVAGAEGTRLTVTRRTLADAAAPVTVTGPDDKAVTLTLEPVGPGKFSATYDAPEMGLYRLSDGTLDAVAALGPAAPKEFEETVASDEKLAALVQARRGGSLRIEDGMPDLRKVREGRPAAGRGWIGITPRGAYVTEDVQSRPFLPAWAYLLLASLFALAAWLWEGRRGAGGGLA